jgi:hypothetical protein
VASLAGNLAVAEHVVTRMWLAHRPARSVLCRVRPDCSVSGIDNSLQSRRQAIHSNATPDGAMLIAVEGSREDCLSRQSQCGAGPQLERLGAVREVRGRANANLKTRSRAHGGQTGTGYSVSADANTSSSWSSTGGTVRPASLWAKFVAYHRCLASARAARHYDGPPRILAVTAGPGAKDRIAAAAAGQPPLPARRWPLLLTTVDLLATADYRRCGGQETHVRSTFDGAESETPIIISQMRCRLIMLAIVS